MPLFIVQGATPENCRIVKGRRPCRLYEFNILNLRLVTCSFLVHIF